MAVIISFKVYKQAIKIHAPLLLIIVRKNNGKYIF